MPFAIERSGGPECRGALRYKRPDALIFFGRPLFKIGG
jgi:hypothetical protein